MTWKVATQLLRSTTTRVALSYLAIIMLLSLGFSAVFYNTAANELGTQARTIDGLVVPRPGSLGLVPGGTPLNQILSQRLQEGRTNLFHNLILLNVVALIGGGSFSFYWARRTLNPIEQAMDAQVRFTSDASHELRTPLAALRVRNEVALRDSRLSLVEAKKVIQDSVHQAAKLEQLSDALLKLARTDHQNLEMTTVSLGHLATEAMNQVLEAAQTKNVSIEETVPAINVYGNTQNLTQVATIVLHNAIKYSDHGSIVHIEARQDKKWGYLNVRDTGRGIRATDLPHIFDRFYRADHARTKQGEQGYGLGLSIAKKIIDQHGGEIIARSAIGKGSTFTIKLPLAR